MSLPLREAIQDYTFSQLTPPQYLPNTNFVLIKLESFELPKHKEAIDYIKRYPFNATKMFHQ